MNTPPRVFVVQPSIRSRDLSSAQRYGTIQYLIDDPQFQPSLQPGVAKKRIEDGLADFRPGVDYILFLGGDPLGAIMLGVALGNMFPGKRISGLRYERERDLSGNRREGSGFYVPALIQT